MRPTDPTPPDSQTTTPEPTEQELLERLYGSPKKQARGQWGLGLAMVATGVVIVALGGGLDEPGLIGAGIVCGLVGLWSFFEGLARARRRDRG